MLWFAIPVIVGMGALLSSCHEEKFEIRKDPARPVPKRVDLFERCFPSANRYHFEIYKDAVGGHCSRLLFNRNYPGPYPRGPMPWKVADSSARNSLKQDPLGWMDLKEREDLGRDFQWDTQFPKVTYVPPPGVKLGSQSYRPSNYALEGTLYLDCSFDLYFSSKPDEDHGYYPWTDFDLFSPRIDGQTCMAEPDYSNDVGRIHRESPICAKFPPHDPAAPFAVESSPVWNGKECLDKTVDLLDGSSFRMRLVRE